MPRFRDRGVIYGYDGDGREAAINNGLDRLSRERFDVLVVGGGIYGAWTAQHAARLGLKTAIIEKDDWGSGTSSASTKLIHGGLRYLEQFRFGLVRTALRERSELVRLAPHLVRPLRFMVPLFESNRVGPLKLRAGLEVYDLFALGHRVGRTESGIGSHRIEEAYPFLNPDGLGGGLYYYDCQTDDFRLTLGVVAGAVEAGALALSRVSAQGLLSDGAGVQGIAARDERTGEEAEIRAKVVVNAAGPWIAGQERLSGPEVAGKVRLSKGIHLVMEGLPTEDALFLMTGDDDRIFFIVPWYGRSLVGTTDTPFEGDPSRAGVTAQEADYLLAQVAQHAPSLGWRREDIVGCFAGLRALADDSDQPLSKISREWQLLNPGPGYLVSLGGKLTTARIDALKITESILEMLDLPEPGSDFLEGSLIPSSPEGDFREWRAATLSACQEAGLDPETAKFLARRHGTGVEQVLELIRERTGLGERIVPDLPFVWAEVIRAARSEMATGLTDILRRRAPLMILARPEERVVRRVAELAGEEFGWSGEEREAQAAATLAAWKGMSPRG